MMGLFAIAVAGLLVVAYFSPWIWRQYRMSHLRNEIVRKRALVLTYDDGPSGTTTPQLLDLLNSRNAHASFFMLGRNARQYPEIVQRAVEEGHDVGCHSDKHLNAWKSWPWKAVADIRAGYDRLSQWIRPNGMFRPPFGKMTLPTYFEIRRRGASVWWWTIDSGDTHGTLPDTTKVIESVRRNGGGIILMHDLHEFDRVEQRNDFVMKLTAGLLEMAKSESLCVVPLRELYQ
jgi:peptidoglycan-N-acetylglucosamine deacetylase